MTDPSPRKSLVLRIQSSLAQARFVSFSLLVHTMIVIAGGSAVIFSVQEHVPDFVSESSCFAVDDVTVSAPVEIPQTPIGCCIPVKVASSPNELDAVIVAGPGTTRFALNSWNGVSPEGTLTRTISTSGVGDKLADAIGRAGRAGGTMTRLGTVEKAPDALVGTFYDLKQTKRGKPTGVTPDEYHKIFRRFVAENWRANLLNDYFRAPKPLYTTQIMIPNMSADEGPKAFGVEKDVQPSRWLVHYRGRVSPPADGTYRFVGAGDDVMIVRFNGKVVLDRCWSQGASDWKPERNYDYGWTRIPNGFARGDALRLKAGQFYDIDVLIGEQPGGHVFACLLVEKDGEEYERDSRGNPILPVFRVAATPMPDLEKGQTLPPHVADGPVWKAISPERGGSGSALDRFTSLGK